MKGCVNILADMYNCEDFKVSSIFDEDVLARFETEYSDADELDGECCKVTAEMVLVRRDSVNGRYYNLVEMADLDRYMESSGIDDVSEALRNIGHANAILDEDSFAIVMDPIEYAIEAVEEAKFCSNKTVKKSKINVIDKAANKLKELKNKGIKVFRKKSKKKK